jgi:peptidoglycan/LPS O-acetylase OafA/YrhL
MAVGHTLLRSETDQDRYSWLNHRVLQYVATVSYALYVLHPLTMYGWLGEGPTPLLKYSRRLICFALTFLGAHVSTFYFEHQFIAWGKALARKRES